MYIIHVHCLPMSVTIIHFTAAILGNIDVKNERGWTAVMLAARNGQTAAVEVLLNKGYDLLIMKL